MSIDLIAKTQAMGFTFLGITFAAFECLVV